jgi:hypothetical protein
MFQATHYPSSGAQNCTSSFWFCIRERLLDVEVAGQRGIINFDTVLHLVGYFYMNYTMMHGSANIILCDLLCRF